MITLPEKMKIGEAYGPAMEITDPEQAREYFEALVNREIWSGHSREEAERVERINLGYYAGYYDTETRKRVERLLLCEHPIFGKAENWTPNTADALWAGVRAAKETAHAE